MAGTMGAKPPFGAESMADVDGRLYRRVAKTLIGELQSGVYGVGDRMPAERDIAITMGVSRPVVREAMLAMEVLGLVEARLGAGTFVIRIPRKVDSDPEFTISPFELIEARRLIEGESAALAARHISEEEIKRLEELFTAITLENTDENGGENADMAFHMAIAKASQNGAIATTVAELWNLRCTSPECRLLLEQARAANRKTVVEEHQAILTALRQRDPHAARKAMHMHLNAVLQHLLFAVEEEAVAAARHAVAATRERFLRSARDA